MKLLLLGKKHPFQLISIREWPKPSLSPNYVNEIPPATPNHSPLFFFGNQVEVIKNICSLENLTTKITTDFCFYHFFVFYLCCRA